LAPLSAIADRRNLLWRVLSGVVLAPLVCGLAYRGGLLFDLAVVTAAGIALREWIRLTRKHPLGGLASAALGLPYIGLAVFSLIWLRDRDMVGWPLTLFVFLIVWASDIGAFVVGRTLRGPRLAPKISPNKTWAGFGGALVFSGGIAVGWASIFGYAHEGAKAAQIAIILSLAGQGGDLFESAMKRRFGVKDSGGLIPGHGGMLDRIDALLFAAPAFVLLYMSGITAEMLR
jgi:phosphatidate cytidylyltransferase